MSQQWTTLILSLLPATTKQINADPRVVSMNATHRAQRRADHKWEKPVNSMVYDTLYRLRKRGIVVRRRNGVYQRVK